MFIESIFLSSTSVITPQCNTDWVLWRDRGKWTPRFVAAISKEEWFVCLLLFLRSLQHYPLLNRFLQGESTAHHRESEVMATTESTAKACIPMADTGGYERKSAQLSCAHAQARTRSSPRAGCVPSSQTSAFPSLDSASAFWSQGIQPYLCSCCSSCSSAQVPKWICLEFGLISETRAVDVHQQVTVAPGNKKQTSGVSSVLFLSWRMVWPTPAACRSTSASKMLLYTLLLPAGSTASPGFGDNWAMAVPSSGLGHRAGQGKPVAQTSARHSLRTS